MRMLRVSHTDNAGGQHWSLCGHLAGPWVEELRAWWSEARRRAPRARGTVDLTDVTFIDEAGERLLAEMQNAGTEFVAVGVENRDLLATLQEKGKRRCGGVWSIWESGAKSPLH
jgi:hypothetical protein